MKKRLLLLLAFGISFAPPVFAAGDVIAKGELKVSETDLRGANCPFMGLKELPSDVQAQNADSRATKAGSARD